MPEVFVTKALGTNTLDNNRNILKFNKHYVKDKIFKLNVGEIYII